VISAAGGRWRNCGAWWGRRLSRSSPRPTRYCAASSPVPGRRAGPAFAPVRRVRHRRSSVERLSRHRTAWGRPHRPVHRIPRRPGSGRQRPSGARPAGLGRDIAFLHGQLPADPGRSERAAARDGARPPACLPAVAPPRTNRLPPHGPCLPGLSHRRLLPKHRPPPAAVLRQCSRFQSRRLLPQLPFSPMVSARRAARCCLSPEPRPRSRARYDAGGRPGKPVGPCQVEGGGSTGEALVQPSLTTAT